MNPVGNLGSVLVDKTGENFRIIYDVKGRSPSTSITKSAVPKNGQTVGQWPQDWKQPLATPWSQKKGHQQHQPTAAPPETGEVKKQTSNSRSSSGRKYRKQSEASIRPRRGL